MSYNIHINTVVNYKPCIKCNKGLSKAGSIYCKNCKPKKDYNRTLNKSQSKAYLRKFEVGNSTNSKEVVKGENLLGIEFIC
jgi:CRISPR/Cas system CMR-associated protein Cmr1 (group 7 of RAMP superfamily)